MGSEGTTASIVSRPRYALVVLVAGALVGASLIVVVAGPASATTISVANETEYRNALTTLSSDASGPHTIDITADIALSGGTDPTYTGAQPLTLAGNGHTLDANSTSRVLLQTTGAALTVQALTVIGGNTTGSGGGISAPVGSVTLTNSTVGGNTAADAGGGVYAVSVTLTDSTVSGNPATIVGGGIFAFGAVTVMNSTVAGNTASQGGGIDAGGLVTVTNSTVSGNTAGGTSPVGVSAGGIFATSMTLTNSTVSGNIGGGIQAFGSMTVTNSTVTGNTARDVGGGILGLGNNTVTLVYATVVGNSAPRAANIGLIGPLDRTLAPFGSVIALPHGGGANCEVGSATSGTYNFSDDASCQLSGTGDRQDAGDPGLGALASNGGSTLTRLPQTGSLLIDAIPVGSCQADGAIGITTDQRGFTRPLGGGCDIGAVEVAATQPPSQGVAPPQPSPTAAVPVQAAAVPVQAAVRFTG